MIEEIQIFDFIITIFKITVVGAVIFTVLSLISKLIRYFFSRLSARDIILKILLIIKILIWIVFGIWCVKILIALPLFSNTFFLFIISSIFLVLLWVMGRDILYGLILRIENALDINRKISTSSFEGTIKKLGLRTLTIESESAERFQIPFSKLSLEKLRSSADEDRFKSFETEIRAQGNINPEKAKSIIFNSIIYSPYCSIRRPPIITYLGEQDNQYKFSLVLFTLNQDYFNRLIFAIQNKLNSSKN